MHTLSIDLSRALKDCPSPSVAIARVLLCQRLEFDQEFILRRSSLLVLKGCTMQLSQLAGTTNRASRAYQVVHNLALFGNGQLFFARTSLRASTSSMRSASRRLRRPFSFSSSLRRCASATLIPPYVLRQR